MAAAVLAILAAGCPLRRAPEVAPAPKVRGAADLMDRVRARSASVSRLDSTLEIRLQGAAAAYRGNFFGTLQMERRDPDGLALWLQVYSLIGAPMLEVIADRDRVEVYSPLDRTLLVNFTELTAGAVMEEFPFSSFSDVALPLDLLKEQIKLLWGLGFSNRFRYDLAETASAYLLTEWEGSELRREMEYARPGLELKSVKVYRGGILSGSMNCAAYGAADDPGGFFPRQVEVREGETMVSLKLGGPRVNAEVSGPSISFHLPPYDRLILLTPPAP
jgi:hypothetical protein